MLSKLKSLFRRPLDLFARHISSSLPAVPGGTYGEQMLSHLAKTFADSKHPLERGDLEQYARQKYQARHPEIFEPDIPEDIEQPIEIDGRLITGERLHVLAYRRLSTDNLVTLFNARITATKKSLTVVAALVVFIGAACLASALALGGLALYATPKTEVSVPDYVSTKANKAQLQRDVWGAADKQAALAEARKAGDERAAEARKAAESANTWARVWQVVASGVMFLSVIAAWAMGTTGLMMIVAAIAAWFVLRPAGIRGAVNVLIDDPDLTVETKESVVRWKSRLEKHRNQLLAYRNQIAQIKRDDELIPELKGWAIELGKGSGTLAFRGAMVGYQSGQPVRIRPEDLHQNMLVVGGIGSGKTFSVLEPMMRQTIELGQHLVKTGAKLKAATVVMGGKGNEWITAKEIGEAKGANVKIIGTKNGEFGFDLFDSLEPHIVSSILRSVMDQLAGGKGGSSDPIWSQTAQMIIEAATTIARAWEVTDGGRRRAVETGERIYSPVHVYALAMSIREPEGLLHQAVCDIADECEKTYDDENAAPHMKPLMSPDLWDAIVYLRKELLSFPEATVGSFLANVSNVLRGFTSMADIRRAFGGCSGDTLDINNIFDGGTVTAVNLSPIVHGDYGRVATIMIKSRIYNHAKTENLTDKHIRHKRKLFVFLDEVQSIMTRGGELSEIGLMNTSRESGLCLICATQGVPALYSALGIGSGEFGIKNFTEMFRTVLCLQVTGHENLELMQTLAGKAMRSNVIDDDQYESAMARRLELGDESMATEAIEPVDIDEAEALAMLAKGAAKTGPIKAGTAKDHRFDWEMAQSHFVAGPGILGQALSAGQSKTVDIIEKIKSVRWRAEDKRDAFMSAGNEMQNLITEEDPQTFGRGQGFFLCQVGGHQRMDIIRLDHTLGSLPKAKPVPMWDEIRAD